MNFSVVFLSLVVVLCSASFPTWNGHCMVEHVNLDALSVSNITYAHKAVEFLQTELNEDRGVEISHQYFGCIDGTRMTMINIDVIPSFYIGIYIENVNLLFFYLFIGYLILECSMVIV